MDRDPRTTLRVARLVDPQCCVVMGKVGRWHHADASQSEGPASFNESGQQDKCTILRPHVPLRQREYLFFSHLRTP